MSAPEIAVRLEAAQQHLRARRWAEAESIYRDATEAAPEASAAWEGLAQAALERERPELAIEAIQRARTIHPSRTAWNVLLARAYIQRRDFTRAHEELKAALAQEPGNSAALQCLGQLLFREQRLRPAAAALSLALRIDPTLPGARLDLARVWAQTGNLEAAFAETHAALSQAPDNARAHSLLGFLLARIGQSDTACRAYRRALELSPGSAKIHSLLIFAQHLDPAFSSADLLAETITWRHAHAGAARTVLRSHDNDRDPERPLRIGYISPDFRSHASSYFVLPLLAHHDRATFHLTAYANVKTPDVTTARFRSVVDCWRDIAGVNDAAVAAQIRDDRIDILVELGLHVDDTRLLVSAHKPAPVQVAWMGYPGTSGLDTIDYLFIDPQPEPPIEARPWSTEEPFPLPETWCCYDPRCDEIGAGGLPAKTAGHVTFGSLNHFNKINPRVLALWARTLAAVPDSRLLLRCPEGPHRRDVLAVFMAQGVVETRIEFMPTLPRLQYLETYRRIDIALDCFPYNGHTTTCDALWMGVPVLTLEGTTLAGRMGRSLVTTAGLPGWIARSEDEYVRLAQAFSSDLDALAQVRATLRSRIQSSALMNGPRFSRAVEAAYRSMWRRWCAASDSARPHNQAPTKTR